MKKRKEKKRKRRMGKQNVPPSNQKFPNSLIIHPKDFLGRIGSGVSKTTKIIIISPFDFPSRKNSSY